MLTLSPAYGRDYTSAKAVKADWQAGKDFRIESYGPDMGRYIGKEEADAEHLTVMIRYKRLTQLCVIKPGAR